MDDGCKTYAFCRAGSTATEPTAVRVPSCTNPHHKVLVVAKRSDLCGNRTTSDRFSRMLATLLPDHEIVTHGVDAAPHIQKTSKVGAGSSPFHGVALVFGLHAYHTGKFLGHCESLGYTLPQHVPVVLVFGGTDVYGAEYLTSPSHMSVMAYAVKRSSTLVAFTEHMRASAQAITWTTDPTLQCAPSHVDAASISEKLHVIPQAVPKPVADETFRFELYLTRVFGTTPKDPVGKTAHAANGSDCNANTCVCSENLRRNAGVHKFFLLPAGLRPVKDVLFVTEAFAAWSAALGKAIKNTGYTPHLLIVGPDFDDAYAAHVRASVDCLSRGSTTAPPHTGERPQPTAPTQKHRGTRSPRSCARDGALDQRLRGGGPVESGDGHAERGDGGSGSVAPQCWPAVAVLGALPQPELFSAMRSATAVVNTSKTEGMCTVLLEAMALGAPVLARNIPGNAAVVKHGESGLLFTTPEEFVKSAQRLCEDDAFRDGLVTNAQRAMQRHTVEDELAMYRRLLQPILAIEIPHSDD